jgi:hypothetical protein
MRNAELCPLNKDSFAIDPQFADVINFQEEEDACRQEKRYYEEGFKDYGKIWHVI